MNPKKYIDIIIVSKEKYLTFYFVTVEFMMPIVIFVEINIQVYKIYFN